MIKLYKKPRAVRVHWHDADGMDYPSHWVPVCDVKDYASRDTNMVTVALCIGETRRYYLFTSTVQLGSDLRDKPHRIPKGCIDRMVTLKPR